MAGFERGEGWQIHDAGGRRKYLSSDERAQFLNAAQDLAPPMRALCHVLTFVGCRISEALATLKRRRCIFRTVPVPQAIIDMLHALPPSAAGRYWTMHRVTAWRAVKATMLRAGIIGPMACPKGLRHGFGIRAAGRSVPTNLIQRWMGHASPITTAIYLDAVGLEERQFASRMW